MSYTSFKTLGAIESGAVSSSFYVFHNPHSVLPHKYSKPHKAKWVLDSLQIYELHFFQKPGRN